jgi:putative inorganic carbon (HCO3(-)) transporter
MQDNLKVWLSWLVNHEVWFLLPSAGLALVKTAWVPWILGFFGLLLAARWITRGHLTVRTPLDKPVILLLLMIPVTLWATIDFEITFVCVSRLLIGLAVYYGIVNWVEQDLHIATLVLGMSAFGFLVAVLTPFVVRFPDGALQLPGMPIVFSRFLPTLINDTVNANMIAGTLVMLLPFPLALFILFISEPEFIAEVGSLSGGSLLKDRWFHVLFHGLTTFLIGLMLFLTQSRGGWVAASVAVFLILVRRWTSLLGVLVLPFVAAAWLAWQNHLGAFFDRLMTSQTIPGLDVRLEVWSRALYMIQDFPFTGIGMGNFQRVANVLYPFFLVGPDAEIPHAHNLLLQIGVDLGIPGLIAFLAIIMLVAWSAIRSFFYYKQHNRLSIISVAWAGLVSLIAMMIHGLVDATTWVIGRGSLVPFILYGLIIALERHSKMDCLKTIK